MNAKCSLSIVVDIFCFVDVVSLITDNTKPTITVNFKDCILRKWQIPVLLLTTATASTKQQMLGIIILKSDSGSMLCEKTSLWFKLLHQSLQIPINRKYIRKYNRKYNRKYRKTATWVHDHDMFWNYCKCRLATYNILLTNHFWKCSAITEPQTSIEILINCLEPSNIIMSMWYNMNIQPVRFGGVAGLYGIWKDLKKDIQCMYNWMYLII